MADNGSPYYEKLYLQEKERLAQERNRREQAEARQKQAEDEAWQEKERNRSLTFMELICHGHNLLSRPLKVRTPSRSTTGTIPAPAGKYCPMRLEQWADCPRQQQEIYNAVCKYLEPIEGAPKQLPTSLIALESDARRFCHDPMHSEQSVESYERVAVEGHVRDIIAELCKIDAARDEFGLDGGIRFDNHSNSLSRDDRTETNVDQASTIHNPKPDQFCIHRIDGKDTLLTTVEYKPPHKLPTETLRVGLRQMDLLTEIVRSNKIPKGKAQKLKYNNERLVCSALVQEYHAMIQGGLEYSWLANGISRVLLRIPHNDPGTLQYFFCDPNGELEGDIRQNLQEPRTSIARVLCLCLMAFRSPLRDHEWRNNARSNLHLWTTSLNHASQISKLELQQVPLTSDSTEYASPESTVDPSLDYQTSSSPLESPTTKTRPRTRSQASCALSITRRRSQSPESSGSDSNQASGRKRGFSQVETSPSAQTTAGEHGTRHYQGNQARYRDAQYCTQRCLLGLQNGGSLDESCPNVTLHRQGTSGPKHLVTADELIRSLKAQLDENIDRCISLGSCGGSGAPFKLTCGTYGYTVIGKGTTRCLWTEVSREAQAYRILQKAQASAVPVFLGVIDLAKIYHLHGAGDIRHMLVMGCAGESTETMELKQWLREEIHKSEKEIKALGVIHKDLWCDIDGSLQCGNVFWNKELGRALIIDFHRCTMVKRWPTQKRLQTVKKRIWQTKPTYSKRSRVL